MRPCGCRWDGNLDGKILRCRSHQLEHKAEKEARKAADQLYRDMMFSYRTTDGRS